MTDKYGSGEYYKYITNPNEDLAGSNQVVNYMIDQLLGFVKEDRVITSCLVHIEYLNTDSTNQAMSSFNNLEKDLVTLETSKMSIDGSHVAHDETNEQLEEKLNKYLKMISDRGQMYHSEYSRFNMVFALIYQKLMGKDELELTSTVTKLNERIKELNAKFKVVAKYQMLEHAGTWKMPESMYELVPIEDDQEHEDPIQDIPEESKPATDGGMKEKIDDFIKSWFNDGKIYDKDRDKFYLDFTKFYNSLMGNKSAAPAREAGVLTAMRRKPTETVEKVLTYGEINKILESVGLDYSITYKQEPGELQPGQMKPKYRHTLVVKPRG